jgi:hypothetical protein
VSDPGPGPGTDLDPLAPAEVGKVRDIRHPDPPQRVTRAALLAAVRECVTLVGPGQWLAVLVPVEWGESPDMMVSLQGAARQLREQGMRVLFVPGEGLAVIDGPPRED